MSTETADNTPINDDNVRAEAKQKPTIKQRVINEVKFFAGLFAFILIFMTLIWGHYKIPSESMQPTLEVGDHLYVSKFAYGYSRHSLPFGLHRLPALPDGKVFSRLPKRGDVIVFRNPRSQVITIKRVAGLPGDKIEVREGRLYINDALIERELIDRFSYREHRGAVVQVASFFEQWPGEKTPHRIYERTDKGRLDNVGPYIIPEDRLFFMGDNRDNSIDSRAPSGPGFVPLDHIIGRADLMMFSFKRCKDEVGLVCPPIRAFKPL